MGNKVKGTTLMDIIIGIVSIIVTIISIIVTMISILQALRKDRNQKSNRSDQS